MPASPKRSVYLIETYLLPGRCDARARRAAPAAGQSCRACANASRTKLACAVRDARQPTMRRA
jgi:hypothetical protein